MKELVVNNYPKSSITEAIKTIKTNLTFSTLNNNLKTILVTSSTIGEGKSFISANLAISFANSDKKVLLIDCDLRKGRQQQIFELVMEEEKGLSNLLIDNNYIKSITKPAVNQASFTTVDFKRFNINIPSKEEQEKIANFFSLIDNKISLQSEKIEALKDYKKGIMQKIFSRELRFKDDEGRDYPEWEERKLGDIIDKGK